MIIRVFPRKTAATPIDDNVRFGPPGMFEPENITAVHISVTFTHDLAKAEFLLSEWEYRYPGIVSIGGPATGSAGENFTPGLYLKPGYVITSRGCRNRCWFCSVWKREGTIRELPVTIGNNVLDDNILATSKEHFKSVFDMLKNQKHRIEFTGGLEAAILTEWHVKKLKDLKPKQLFFAYDTPDDKEPLFEAGKLLHRYLFKSQLRCYNLIGFPKDTFQAAEKRLHETIAAGFMPMAMLWRNDSGTVDQTWKRFQREWARPAIIRTKIKELLSVNPT